MGETAGDWDVGDVEAAGDLNDELTRILQFCFVDFMFCSDVIKHYSWYINCKIFRCLGYFEWDFNTKNVQD